VADPLITGVADETVESIMKEDGEANHKAVDEFDVVIVGAGHAGATLANALVRKKFTGSVLLVSDEIFQPYHRPPLSKEYLNTDNIKSRPLLTGGVLSSPNVTFMPGCRISAGDLQEGTVTLTNGAELGFKKLVLATGASPRKLTIEGADLEGILSLKTLVDAEKIRDSLLQTKDLVLVGGGFINLELACSLAGAGRNITVLEQTPRLLQRAVSPVMSEFLKTQAEKLGVRILLNEEVSRFEGDDNRISHVLTAAGERFKAGLAVVAIGSVPDPKLAQDLGLESSNGIIVNGQLQAATNVYAVGDCAFFPDPTTGHSLRLESVQNATDQASYVAEELVGSGQEVYHGVSWFWSVQGDNRLQIAGLAKPGSKLVVSGNPADGNFAVYHYLDKLLCAVETINRPGEHMLARKMLKDNFSPTEAQVTQGVDEIKAALASWEANTTTL
jgi:3-phenylpropionate/trans-cinnamate dioxygenase ferredoxin reductase subunit